MERVAIELSVICDVQRKMRYSFRLFYALVYNGLQLILKVYEMRLKEFRSLHFDPFVRYS
jgi:hypothetical protein